MEWIIFKINKSFMKKNIQTTNKISKLIIIKPIIKVF